MLLGLGLEDEEGQGRLGDVARLTDALDQQWEVGVVEERVHPVRDDETDHAGAVRCQRACCGVGPVSRLADHRLHSLTHLGTDTLLVVDHAGDGGPGNSGHPSDLLERELHLSLLGSAPESAPKESTTLLCRMSIGKSGATSRTSVSAGARPALVSARAQQ